MTSLTAGAIPSDMSVIEEMAEMDACMRQFMVTAARYVFSGAARSAGGKSRDFRDSEK